MKKKTQIAPSPSSTSLIKHLASNDTKTRNVALKYLLKTWLPSQPEISEDEMKKLWKGLFYCVWHSDKLPAQSLLIDRLSSLLVSLPFPLSLQFLSVFLLTIRREWSHIDSLRLDKFYLLIRKFVHSVFVLLRNNGWDSDVVKDVMGILMNGSFFDGSSSKGCGVGYHVATVFIEELKGFMPLSRVVVEAVVCPFVLVLGRVSDKVLLGKVKKGMFDELLRNGRRFLDARRMGVEVGCKDDVGLLGPVALVMGFSSRLYEMGSSVECCQGNRKVVFGLHEEFLKLEKDCVGLGIEVSLPDVVDDEVPKLVPIGGGNMEVDGPSGGGAAESSEEGKRAKKKAKKGSGGGSKKGKKNKNLDSGCVSENVSVNENGNGSIDVIKSDDSSDGGIAFSESVISNLQMQFEKVAEELGSETAVGSCCDANEVDVGDAKVSKKRKRVKGKKEHKSGNGVLVEQTCTEGTTPSQTGEKSAKKVRFSMKNNLVWKPQSPLPPQEMRLPPSVTPRGSALKKGVPPGPIREIPAATKKAKLRPKAMKKGRKGVLVVAKRMKKLKSIST